MAMDVKKVLSGYVENPEKWFFWYHNPKRLEALHNIDVSNPNRPKKPWEFESKKDAWKFKIEERTGIQEDLHGFFKAELDEVRIKKANAFARYALYISDIDDLAYFREAVAKREYTADIDYNKQRDHAVHTLYNYILGWYIFEHSEKLRNAFKAHFEKLHISLKINLHEEEFYTKFYNDSNNSNKIKPTRFEGLDFNASLVLVNEFGDVWPIASLLHDIGYILEGDLSSASPQVENIRVSNGAKIIHDYFNHLFWKDVAVDFRATRNIAKTLRVEVPDFKSSKSLVSLGDHLCDIGSCENIRKKLLEKGFDKTNTYISDPNEYYDPIVQDYGLNREAFSIWKEHYKFYNRENMSHILEVVEALYKDTMWIGSNQGKRSLNHGVCSGLIALQALTFSHELYWGLDFQYPENWESNQETEKVPYPNRVSVKMFTDIKKTIIDVPERIKIRGGFHPEFWFRKVLWATASAAIHALIQKEDYKKKCEDFVEEGKPHLTIHYTDDPLAFLGGLSDILQEWDRYTVTGESAFSDTDLLQSSDVEVDDSNKNAAIYFYYPKGGNGRKEWKTDLTKSMDNCLNEWDDIVKIKTVPEDVIN